jgi:hypothetical protein
MGVPGVSERTSQLSLYTWQDNEDFYQHGELASNWEVVDKTLLKKKWGGTTSPPAGDYAEQIRFAGTASLGTVVLSIRSGSVTSGTINVTDANDRFNILTGGTVNWGNGTGATDLSVYRAGTSTLGISGTVSTPTVLLSNSSGVFAQQAGTNAATTFLSGKVSGDTYNRYAVTAGGTVMFGSGSADTDSNLFRSGSALISTDSAFQIIRTSGTAINLINTTIGNYPSLSANTSGTLSWGAGTSNAYDVSLGRSGPGTLTITNTMTSIAGNGSVSGNFSINGDLTVNGNFSLKGQVGFFGSATTQSTGWGSGPSNVSSTKTYNANSVSINELANTLGNVIFALKNYGILGV